MKKIGTKLSNTLCPPSTAKQLRLTEIVSAAQSGVEEGEGGFNGCLGQECDVTGGHVGLEFQIGGKYGRGGIWQFVYDTNRPAILKGNQVRLGVDGNR